MSVTGLRFFTLSNSGPDFAILFGPTCSEQSCRPVLADIDSTTSVARLFERRHDRGRFTGERIRA